MTLTTLVIKMEIEKLLEISISKSASDIHIAPNNPPMMRINGDMTPLLSEKMDTKSVIEFLKRHVKLPEGTKDLDFSISHNGNRFRGNFFYSQNGPSLVLRIIKNEIITLDQLGVPEVIKKITSLKQGLVLATGPTGSGKSTTINAILDHINQTYNYHIITIEDPIEFLHTSKKSLFNQREINTHTKSFSNALKAAFREDPDVIFIGEMRDIETISLALTAAETGHLVFGTLHTSSAPTTIDRIIDVFPENDKKNAISMLANSLQAVISQRLLLKADHSSRIGAYEILIPNSAIRNLIREYQIAQIPSMMQTSKAIGNCLMEDYITSLVEQGIVDEDALKYIQKKQSSPLSSPPLINKQNTPPKATSKSSQPEKKAPTPPVPAQNTSSGGSDDF